MFSGNEGFFGFRDVEGLGMESKSANPMDDPWMTESLLLRHVTYPKIATLFSLLLLAIVPSHPSSCSFHFRHRISYKSYSVWYSRSIQPKWMAQECYRSAKTGSCVSHDFVWTGQGRNLRSLKIARWLGMVSENDLKMLIFLIKWYEMIWDVQKTTRKNH